MYHSVPGTSNIGKVLSFIKWKSESESVSSSVECDSATSFTVASHALLSMEFSRQEYWNGLPFPSPGDIPDPGIKPRPPALQANFLPSVPPGRQPFINWNGAHNKKLGRESFSDKNCGNPSIPLQVQRNSKILWGFYAIHHVLTSIYMGRALFIFKKKSKERIGIRLCHTVFQVCITVLFSNILWTIL